MTASVRLHTKAPHTLGTPNLTLPTCVRMPQIRASITALFPNRDCFALVRPMSDERALQHLEEVPAAQLRPEFREACPYVLPCPALLRTRFAGCMHQQPSATLKEYWDVQLRSEFCVACPLALPGSPQLTLSLIEQAGYMHASRSGRDSAAQLRSVSREARLCLFCLALPSVDPLYLGFLVS